ncbi:cytochrome P450 [Athelia psychrophila]|uniref:Cytochrome P450 n=1 Tax=Athelia psychrophila TaxID=1759441 RepID=A0A166R258_9AGAM|nr:cytochrome P450 [Fibularhizoctonia sp. CBS 109695]
MILQVLWVAVVTGCLVAIYKAAAEVLRRVRSPLGDLPGPKPSHWFLGNFAEILSSNNEIVGEWTARWGPTVSFYSVFRDKSLCTVDAKAVNHILSRSNTFQKPKSQSKRLATLFGKGLLFAEGDAHKNQRKFMTPAFGPIQINALTEIFNEKSIELREVLSDLIAKNESVPLRVNISNLLSQTTLDIIGKAGFGYDFGSLDITKPPNELSHAFSGLFKGTKGSGLMGALRMFMPWMMHLPTAARTKRNALKEIMARFGNGLLADAKTAHARDESGAQGRDLLSLLVHANTAADIPPSQRLSDEDVLAQVPTFLIAGHETTSVATSWVLFCLTQSPDVQRKLRQELLQVSTDSPSMDELNNLRYLDHVVREVLRLYPPVPMTLREAAEDDMIPLDTPIVDTYGRTRESVRVNKGDLVLISIKMINLSKDTWGPDALEFRPERWDDVPDNAHKVPGVWGNQLTFSAGPRACIGYKFSLVELKALLFALLCAFEFELAVPGSDIRGMAGALTQRPFVVSERGKGTQLPLIIKPYAS